MSEIELAWDDETPKQEKAWQRITDLLPTLIRFHGEREWSDEDFRTASSVLYKSIEDLIGGGSGADQPHPAQEQQT